jgi:hypothetical protein
MISYPYLSQENLQTRVLYSHNPYQEIPSPRQGLTSILYKNKIYIFFGFGGVNNQFEDLNDLYEFNKTHKVFKKIFQFGDIPSARAGKEMFFFFYTLKVF